MTKDKERQQQYTVGKIFMRARESEDVLDKDSAGYLGHKEVSSSGNFELRQEGQARGNGDRPRRERLCRNTNWIGYDQKRRIGIL